MPVNYSAIISAFKNGSPVAFDAATESGNVTNTVLTFAHTCSGTFRALIVGVTGDTTANDVNSVTYNGVAMSKINTVQVAANRYLNIWLLLNPASGANNVVVTADTSHFIQAIALSYTGCKQTGGADSTANKAEATTSFTISTTTVEKGSMVVMIAKGKDEGLVAGTNTVERSTSGATEAFDSSVGRVPEGSNSLNITSGSQNIGACILSLAPKSLFHFSPFPSFRH